MSKPIVCCPSMEILIFGKDGKGPTTCEIELDDEGRLISCDDYGDRLPPFKYCPWCGKIVRPNV